MKVSVDYEKIYFQKPLLMGSEEGSKTYNLAWDPIF